MSTHDHDGPGRGHGRQEPEDERDLELLRGWRSRVAQMSDDAEARVRERMWQLVLSDEAKIRQASRPRRRGWMRTIARQVPVAAVAVLAVLAFNGQDTPTGTNTAVASTGAAPVLDAAASNITAAPMSDTGSMVTDPPQQQVRYQQQPSDDGTDSWVVVPDSAPVMPDPLRIAAGPAAVAAEEMLAIPTDEQLLLAILRSAAPTTPGRDVDFEPFRIAAMWVTDRGVPVELRAAFLRMLALVDGVDVGGESSDVIGRVGLVVARLDEASGIRQQYLLEQSSGRLLEHREFTTRGDIGSCPPGTTTELDLYDATDTRFTAVDQAGQPVARPECAPA